MYSDYSRVLLLYIRWSLYIYRVIRTTYYYGSILCMTPPILHKMVPIYIQCHMYYYGDLCTPIIVGSSPVHKMVPIYSVIHTIMGPSYVQRLL